MDYQKVYNDLVSFRILNPLVKSEDLYTEDHHIVPSCLSGPDEPDNLVRLTAREHFIAHRLLSKIHPYHAGLAYAILFMSRLQNRKIYSREYDRLKDLASRSVRLRWEDPKFREMMSAVNSKVAKQLWNDPRFKSMMTSQVIARWEDPEYRKIAASRSKQQWEDPKFKETMSLSNKRRWKDPKFKEMMTSRSKELWEDPEYRSKTKEARSDWLKERNGCPWLMPNSLKTKNVWSLAQVFWDLSKNNPNALETYSIKEFCRIFNEGKNINIFNGMHKRFVQNNWVPGLDPNWVNEFGHIRY